MSRRFALLAALLGLRLTKTLLSLPGIGPKVSQSVLTAALLFAFKDVLYEQTVRLRGAMARKSLSS